jgi:hypothetical protein
MKPLNILMVLLSLFLFAWGCYTRESLLLLCGVASLLCNLLPLFLAKSDQVDVQQLRRQGLYPAPGKGADHNVKQLKDAGFPDYAIRLYREIHGVGLKEATEAVKQL